MKIKTIIAIAFFFFSAALYAVQAPLAFECPASSQVTAKYNTHFQRYMLTARVGNNEILFSSDSAHFKHLGPFIAANRTGQAITCIYTLGTLSNYGDPFGKSSFTHSKAKHTCYFGRKHCAIEFVSP